MSEIQSNFAKLRPLVKDWNEYNFEEKTYIERVIKYILTKMSEDSPEKMNKFVESVCEKF